MAQAVRHVALDIAVFGSILIGDKTSGGLACTVQTIENHAQLGCKVLWFPAFNVQFCRSELGQSEGISILNDNGSLKSEIDSIIDVVKNTTWFMQRTYVLQRN